ncbi:hypothetical protein [Bradyrhizobium sp. S69]|uniref:hypothetical protein n=1 Tax=Bradyrhizobium sp. S69 TaxID=1641856 RepID=UPI00131C4D77|nr:hypothetical protein [Bradyrhizobium sp. S69]
MAIDAIVKDEPTLLSVRDDVANEWAVFYLSDPPLLIAPYRRYMAQEHVIPFIRAQGEFATAKRTVCGASTTPIGQSLRISAESNQATSGWAVQKREFFVVTARGGSATLTATAQAGPRAVPGSSNFHLAVEDAAGYHQTTLQLGRNRLLVNLIARRAAVAITVEEPVTGSVPSNGNLRPIVLRLTCYEIERYGESQRRSAGPL